MKGICKTAFEDGSKSAMKYATNQNLNPFSGVGNCVGNDVENHHIPFIYNARAGR
jgi:hypothetical protein